MSVCLSVCLSHLRSAGSAERTSYKKLTSVPRALYVFNISRFKFLSKDVEEQLKKGKTKGWWIEANTPWSPVLFTKITFVHCNSEIIQRCNYIASLE